MAEKQYKNYDERFLKEESSGSRPILTYPEGTQGSDVYVTKGDVLYVVLPKEDGSYCQTSDDLEDLFIKNFIFSLDGSMTIPIFFTMTQESSYSFFGIMLGGPTTSPVYAVTEPTLNQLKQS